MFPKDQTFVTEYNKKMEEIKMSTRQTVIEDYMRRLNLYLADQRGITPPIDSGFVDMEIKPIEEVIGLKEASNYFSNERIAVYTAIFGPYDEVLEPLTQPDNVDFFIFTDQEVPADSVWQEIEVDLADYDLEEANSMIKNRFFKILPHLFFGDSDYKYSLYVDGNEMVMTDPTEFIHRMNKYGMLFHDHYRVDCSYVEVERSRVQKIGSDAEYDEHNAYLRSEGFPEKYGLLECPIILREHDHPTCQMIMEEWWESFLAHSKRDQVNLPIVLWRHGIHPYELTGLGTDIYSNYAFLKVDHTMSREERAAHNGVEIE